VVLAACKGDAKPPSAAPAAHEPATPAVVVSPDLPPRDAGGGAVAELADASEPIAPVALVLQAGGVGPITHNMSVSKKKLRRLLPGYTMVYDGSGYNKMSVTLDREVLIRIAADDDKATLIDVVSPRVASEIGVKVGTRYEAAVAALGALDCAVPPRADPRAGGVVCASAKLHHRLAFAVPPPALPGATDGGPIPAKQLKTLLAGAAISHIFVE
jgi:hypothetical protein